MESINTLENVRRTLPSDYMNDYCSRQISLHREELAKLQLMKTAANGTGETLETVLNMLIGKKIKKFTIIFDRGEIFGCELKLVKKSVEISIPRIRHLLTLFWFDDHKFDHLLKLGFEFNKKTNKLAVKLPFENSDLTSTRFLLSRLVFEVFDHSQFKNQSFIEYEEKGSR